MAWGSSDRRSVRSSGGNGGRHAVSAMLAQRREAMVREQLRGRGITDERVLAAMAEVPRHLFVAPQYADEAYEDHPVGIGEGQTISQPYMVALMTQALQLKGGERVLDVGTGSGYQAAVLSRLAATVYTIEAQHSLAADARERLRALGLTNVIAVEGDGSEGYPPGAPYDGIVVAAAAPEIPPLLAEQLADGGRLVIPIGSPESQELVQLTKVGDQRTIRSLGFCRFVPLLGKYGWQG